jgi:protein KIBRA
MTDGGGHERKRAASSTNSNPRSAVSAAVSDESVAGDSGVFEAAQHPRKEDLGGLAMSLETAQVQVKLRYSR